MSVKIATKLNWLVGADRLTESVHALILKPPFSLSVIILLNLWKIENIKQLLDEVEHDIMNYQNRGLCYLMKPKAEADNTDTRF